MIADAARPGEHVLDLFGGSGSTLIAAEQNGLRMAMWFGEGGKIKGVVTSLRV